MAGLAERERCGALWELLPGGACGRGRAGSAAAPRETAAGAQDTARGCFRLGLGSNFFIESAIRLWNELLRELAESPSLEVLKERLICDGCESKLCLLVSQTLEGFPSVCFSGVTKSSEVHVVETVLFICSLD